MNKEPASFGVTPKPGDGNPVTGGRRARDAVEAIDRKLRRSHGLRRTRSIDSNRGVGGDVGMVSLGKSGWPVSQCCGQPVGEDPRIGRRSEDVPVRGPDPLEWVPAKIFAARIQGYVANVSPKLREIGQ